MTKRKKVLRTGRRRFSDEFKDEALRQLAERRAAGETVEQIARDLDVDPTLLRVWARTRGAPDGHVPAHAIEGRGDGTAQVESPAAELRRLRRDNARLRQEHEFLKRASAASAFDARLQQPDRVRAAITSCLTSVHEIGSIPRAPL